MNDKNINEQSQPKHDEPREWEWQLAEQEFEAEREQTHAKSNKLPAIVIALLLIVTFTVLSLPDLQMFIAGQFDFMKDNARLRNDSIVTTVKPAVVSIEAGPDSGFSRSVRQGTGFNILSKGRIITNRHIVEGSKNIKITFDNGNVFFASGYTEIAGMDLVVIELDSQDLPAIAINKTGRPDNGQQVTIVGNPLGLQRIAQRGRVGQYHFTGDNQTLVFDVDIPINPGNSGSPVIDDQAQVVGIVFASTELKSAGKTEVRALAIPINVLQAYAPAD
ncbi:MAG TPA: serine protease [Syntrophomonas sp.]|jgi:serine protease Do|nr:serine protease [Syntrophomonas sp.]